MDRLRHVAAAVARGGPAPAGSAGSPPTAPPRHGDMLPESDEFCTDEEAEATFAPLIERMNAYYEKRGIF